MMSANAAKLKKKAADFEQKKHFDKALSLYIELLEDNPRELDDSDLQLYNRVGDLLTRQGNVTDALTWYEKAIDVYAERGFLNNAIALCNKILRQSPSRAAMYYKLGKISATKGFKSDAKKNFLEYADRMQHAGQVDEAFRALKEFADLCPDQDDVRLMLAEWLARENRKSEAVEQLETLYSKLESEGRKAEASATLTRIQAIDPAITPRASGAWIAQKANDLIFLDLEDSSLPRRPDFDADVPAERAPSRPASPVRVPALEGLTLTFVPEDDDAGAPAERLDGLVSSLGADPDVAAIAPLHGFEATTEAPPEMPESTGHVGRLMTDEMAAERRATEEPAEDFDLSDVLASPLQQQLRKLPVAEPDDAPPLEIDLMMLPPVGATAEQAAIASPLPEMLDLIIEEQARSEGANLDDAIAAAFLELGATDAAPPASFESGEAIDMIEPVESIELTPAAEPRDRPETSELLAIDGSGRPTDEVLLILESEPDLALPLTSDALPPLELPVLDTADDEAAVALEDAEIEAAFEQTADVAGDAAPREKTDGETAGALESEADRPGDEPETTSSEPGEDAEAMAEPFQVADEPVSDETFAVLPTFGEDAGEVPFAPEPVLAEGSLVPDDPAVRADAPEGDWNEDATPEVLIDGEWRDEHVGDLGSHVPPATAAVPPAPVRFDDLAAAMLWPPAPGSDEAEAAGRGAEAEQGRAVLSFGNEEAQLRRRVELDPGNWAMRRQLGEALLEFGQRAEGLDELEMSMRGLERQGDLEGARGVANVILRVDPTSVRHHQKLVEYAVRASDRPRLIEAYIDLADALFRSGEPSKASVVYTRVLELAPGNARAVAALGMLGPDAPAAAEHMAGAGEGGTEGAPDADDRRPPPAASVPPRLTTEMAVLGSVLARPDDLPTAETDTALAAPRAQPADDGAAAAGQIGGTVREPTGERAVVAEIASASAPADAPPAEPRSVPASAPVAGGDDDYVDLGDWLRATEPVRSTRMVTNEVAPTGDERADFDDMLRRFKQGVAENVDEEDYDSHYDLGVAFKEMGLVDEAISEFQKALRGENQRVRAYEALGQCFVEKGQMQVAVTLLRRACETTGADDQQLVGVLYLLGFASQSTGRHGDALSYYQRVFAVDIAFRDVAQRVADLEHSTP